jgi:low affinity Fe/Cu permease
MASQQEKSWLDRIGYLVSSWVSDIAATPFAQIGIVVICAAWFLLGYRVDIMTAILSIMAITLTQMVLNRQNEREADDHRRDVAMHAKLDELLIATKRARNEMAGIEELEEDEIAVLKEEVKESIDQAGEAAGDEEVRAAAKEAAATGVEKAAEVKKSRAPAPASERKA